MPKKNAMGDEICRRGGIAPGDAYAALQTKLEEMDAYTHNVLHQFPRLERHLLCSDMRGAMNRMQRLLATAWKRRQTVRMLELLGGAVNALALALNPKTAYHPWQRGVDFAGYRIWPTHLLPRKRNIKRATADFRKLAKAYAAGRVDGARVRQRVDAFRAYTKHCSAEKTTRHVLQDLERRAIGAA